MNTAITPPAPAQPLPEAQRRAIIEAAFGALADLHEENLQIMDLIDEEFSSQRMIERMEKVA